MQNRGTRTWRIGFLALAAMCHPLYVAAQTHDPWAVRIAPGEEWTYATRSADSSTTVVIEADENEHRDVHVCVRGVVLHGRGGTSDSSLAHLVVAGYYLRKSLRARVASGVTPDCEAGHAAWLQEQPYPPVYTASLRGLIGILEQRRWPVKSDTLLDPRRCTLTVAGAEPDSSRARRCAEQFVAENGYSEYVVLDSTRVVSETIEFGSLEDILDQRHNTLVGHAESTACGDRDCGVVFRYVGHDSRCAMRVVTMDRHFEHLRMQHQEVTTAKAAAAGKCE